MVVQPRILTAMMKSVSYSKFFVIESYNLLLEIKQCQV